MDGLVISAVALFIFCIVHYAWILQVMFKLQYKLPLVAVLLAVGLTLAQGLAISHSTFDHRHLFAIVLGGLATLAHALLVRAGKIKISDR